MKHDRKEEESSETILTDKKTKFQSQELRGKSVNVKTRIGRPRADGL